jgi:hypothetical protein
MTALLVITNLGGLDLSRRQKRVSLDGQESLDGRESLDSFKKLVLTIEISRSRSRNLNLVLMSLAKTVFFGRDRDLSRLVKIFVLISDFCGFLNFFLDLDQEIMDFYKYIDRDFSSQPYLFTFCASKWAKSVGNSNFFKKSRQKSQLSQKSMVISIYLDSLD